MKQKESNHLKIQKILEIWKGELLYYKRNLLIQSLKEDVIVFNFCLDVLRKENTIMTNMTNEHSTRKCLNIILLIINSIMLKQLLK